MELNRHNSFRGSSAVASSRACRAWTLVRKTLSKSASDLSPILLSASTPAPWTRPVTGPQVARTASSAASMASRSVTSVLMYRASPPAALTAAMVSRTSRPARMWRLCQPRSAGVTLTPRLRASVRSARLMLASSLAVATQAGSGLSLVRPSRAKRALVCRATAMTQAAVTPRAPPVTTMTSSLPRWIGPPSSTSAGMSVRVQRLPSAVRPTSSSGPPVSSSSARSSASSWSERSPRSRSMDRAWPTVHSRLAVRARAAMPASQARSPSSPHRPNLPPVSCTTTSSPPSRPALSKARTAWKASRFRSAACSVFSMGARPSSTIRPVASSGTSTTSSALTPRMFSSSTSSRERAVPSEVTATRAFPGRCPPESPIGGASTASSANRPRPSVWPLSALVGVGAAGPPRAVCRWSTTAPSVVSVAMAAASTSGRPGARSCTALRISTRLMLSMPRSPSSDISRASMSAG